MGNMKGRQVRRGTSNREAEVKPRGPGAKADLPIVNCDTESPMFACRHLTLPNRRGTDPYARWCGRGGAVRLPPIPICCLSKRFSATTDLTPPGPMSFAKVTRRCANSTSISFIRRQGRADHRS